MTTTTKAEEERAAMEPAAAPVEDGPEGGSGTSVTYLVADLFAGAGGSSTGAQQAIRRIGGRMKLVAVNHWPVAVETHQRNHPEARHYVEDLERADPETIVPEGYLDLLMASPECRFYSRARGGKPVHDQGRMSPWIVQRWLTSLDVRCVAIENVPEFTAWGPLDRTGRPIKSQKGMYFQEWVRSMWGLGYQVEWRMLNAADFGDATTRIRFFLQARKDGILIAWPQPTHAKEGGGELMGGLPRWRAAREIIDWDDPGRSLLDDPRYRRKQLSIKTRRRIARGLDRFGGALAPLYIRLLDLPDEELPEPGARAPAEAGAGHLVRADSRPFVQANRNHNVPRDTDEPIPTLTTAHGGGNFIVRPGAEPFLLGQQSGGAPRDAGEPAPTITGGGAIALVLPENHPLILSHQRGATPRSQDEPVPATMAGGTGHLVEPMIIQYYGQSYAQGTDRPLSTITRFNKHGLIVPTLEECGDSLEEPLEGPERHLLVNPSIIQVNHGNGQQGDRGNDRRAHSVDGPLPAITTAPGMGIAHPTLVEVNHGDGEQQKDRRTPSLGEPLPSPTSRRAVGLADPVLVQTGQTGGNGAYARDTGQPVPTLTTKNDMTVVTPTAEAFVVPNFGEREGQEPRCHDTQNPLPAVTSRGAGSLVSPQLDETFLQQLEQAQVDPRRVVMVNGRLYLLDIRFRMLQNSELARAMGFDDEEQQYEFVGNIGEVTKQIGNAVPVRLASALVAAALGAG